MRPAKRLRPGDALVFTGLGATVESKAEDGSLVLALRPGGSRLSHSCLNRKARYPCRPTFAAAPPTRRTAKDYQTLFAKHDGSVAAPTAGLHFTPELMAALADSGITTAGVTLHVGAGTFQPVRVDDTDAHTMHAEWGEVSAATARAVEATRILRRPRRVDRHDLAAAAGIGGAPA